MADSDAVLVLSTIAADADGAALARALVGEGLAACVGILPGLTSVYRWQGRVEEAREQQVVIKTTPARLAALEARWHALHPYDVPEFIVLEGAASRAYGAWLAESTGGSGR